MNRFQRLLSVFSVSALAFTLMGAYNPSSPYVPKLPVAHDAAMIFNPGNADYAGYRIVVEPNGRAAAVDGAGRASNELQPDIVQKFFADLASAGPLDKLGAGDCSAAKPDAALTSVELNAAMIITWNGQHTAALSCVTDARAVKLLLDATTIQRSLYVQAYRKRVMFAYGGAYYTSNGYQSQPAYGSERFYIPQFRNDSFTFTNFSTGGFYFSNFDSGIQRSNGPWSAAPSGSAAFTNLPYSNPFSGAPSSNIEFVNPFTASPYSSFESASPFVGNPYSSAPFSNNVPTVVTHP